MFPTLRSTPHQRIPEETLGTLADGHVVFNGFTFGVFAALGTGVDAFVVVALFAGAAVRVGLAFVEAAGGGGAEKAGQTAAGGDGVDDLAAGVGAAGAGVASSL